MTIRLGYGRFLSVARYRFRKGLPPDPKMSGPLTDDPDWSYPDGRPGIMNKGQSERYLRDQELATSMVKYMKKLNKMKEFKPNSQSIDGPDHQTRLP